MGRFRSALSRWFRRPEPPPEIPIAELEIAASNARAEAEILRHGSRRRALRHAKAERRRALRRLRREKAQVQP